MSWLRGKRVLVTGGAGAFGRRFLFAAKEMGAAGVVVVSRDEMKHASLRRSWPGKDDGFLRILNGDVTNPQMLRPAMHDVDCIVHAAAMKHLPECELNVSASTRANVLGTQGVVDSFLESPRASTLVFLSTDKAPYASSAYGAQKYLGEKLVTAANETGKRAFSLRYSNVMDSTGSVFHVFAELLSADKTATVNGSQTSRGFVSQAQVIGCLEAALELSRGGEVHVLRPQVVRISELAELMREVIGRGKVRVVEEPGFVGEKESATLIMREEVGRARAVAGLPAAQVVTLDLLGRHAGSPAPDLPAHGLTLEDCPDLSGVALKDFVRPLLESSNR